ncbi:DUF7535 family protein [Natronomonas salsuginis]|jgi:hypothetical protein|uniref:Uncharacterized protein n=1 Tax=Natronomonas salsuginis TaxID=2217661 RepID=A0A4U5JD55_9EURY|nr:hypothetical protein [Natronomonas salsuginis]TKR25537.1 hypothetical protein DM868_08930 [Natronomonas salsuginis]
MIKETAAGRLKGAVRSIRGTEPEPENDQLANPKIAAAAALLVVLLPLVPFLVIVWMVSKTLRGVRKRVSWE